MENFILRFYKINPNLLKWNKKDFLFFYVMVPSLILLIYSIPQNIKTEYLVLFPSEPTLISMFFSNYTHSSFFHLRESLIAYFIIVFSLYNLETDKKFFYKVSLFFFVLLPFLSSIGTIYMTPYVNSEQGFSTILSAFTGYLIYAVYGYLKNLERLQINKSFIGLILTINFSYVMILNPLVSDFLKTLLVISFVCFIVGSWVTIKAILREIIQNFIELKSNSLIFKIYKISIFLTVIALLFSFPKLIPSNIKLGDNVVIGVFQHYIGYLFGITSPLIMEMKRR
jgi:hypothetical protein